MQIFANLLRFWLIGLIRTAEALICGKCENGFEAIPNIFVTKDSALAGCVKHSSHECQSNDVCLVETIRRKDSTDRWTVISGCQPKGQHFIKNFCVYKDLPQGEFYRCRCDTDNCNAHTTDVLQEKFDIVIENDDDSEVFYQTVPIDWLDQIKNPPNPEETDENDRRKRENHEKQFNISEFVDSRAMKFVEKLLNGNQTGDFLAQVKEQTKIERPKPIVQEIQTTVEPHTVDVPATLSCYKCTIKSGKEEECKPDQVLMVSVHADRNHTNWCVTSVEKSTKGIERNLKFALSSEALIKIFNTSLLKEGCATTTRGSTEFEICICNTDLCNNKPIAEVKKAT